MAVRTVRSGRGREPLPVFLPSGEGRHAVCPCLDGAEEGVVRVGREVHRGAGDKEAPRSVDVSD